MKAVRATYKNGKIKFADAPPAGGPVEVLVVFPNAAEDPWDEILAEKAPRESFAKFANDCLEQIAKGKAKPLRLDQL